MFIPIIDNARQHLIIFLHGFTGDHRTWYSPEPSKSLLLLLQEDEYISSKFDITAFGYFTKLTDLFAKERAEITALISSKSVVKRNFPITQIADLLSSQIEITCKRYDNIILVGHSMGGLVAKAGILKLLLKEKASSISHFFSLAVPHLGALDASYGALLFQNPQIKNLQWLDESLLAMELKWQQLAKDNPDQLPYTYYFHANNDGIVSESSSIPFKSGRLTYATTEANHFTITRPVNTNDIILTSIKDVCNEILTKSAKYSENSKSRAGSINNVDSDYFPSFKRIEHISVESNPEKLYCGFEATLSDIANEYTISRESYTNPNGIKEKIDEFLRDPKSQINCIFISGPGGSGKSTIAKTICFEYYQLNEVYQLQREIRTNQITLQDQFVHLIKVKAKKIIIIDAAAKFINTTQCKIEKLIDNYGESNSLIIFIDQLYHLKKAIPAYSDLSNYPNCKAFTVIFTDSDRHHLIEKIIGLELSGKIVPKTSRKEYNERAKLLNDMGYQANHLVAVLLVIRFSSRFKDIVLNEYKRLERKDEAEIYLLICISHCLDIPLYHQLLAQYLNVRISALYDSLQSLQNGLIIYDSVTEVHLCRNKIIAKQLIFTIFQFRIIELANKIQNIFLQVRSDDIYGEYFMSYLKNKLDLIPTIFKYLSEDRKVASKLFKMIREHIRENSYMYYKDFIAKYAFFLRNIGEYKASLLIIREFSNEPRELPIRLQLILAYNLLKLEEFSKSAYTVKMVFDRVKLISPENLFECALYLSLNTTQYFYQAESYFKESLSLFKRQNKIGTVEYKNCTEKYNAYLNKREIYESNLHNEVIIKKIFGFVRPGLALYSMLAKTKSEDEFVAVINSYLLQLLEKSSKNDEESFDMIESSQYLMTIPDIKAKVLCYKGRQLFITFKNDPFGNQNSIELIQQLFESSILQDGNNYVTRNFYGTFLKECLGNYNNAEYEYRRSLTLATEAKSKEYIVRGLANILWLKIDWAKSKGQIDDNEFKNNLEELRTISKSNQRYTRIIEQIENEYQNVKMNQGLV